MKSGSVPQRRTGLRLQTKAILLVLCCLSLSVQRVHSQPCGPTGGWLPGSGLPGTNGSVLVTMPWDPDGDGPLGIKYVLGGSFTIGGDVQARNIVLFDPDTGRWSRFGSGLGTALSSGPVHALAVLPNGELVAGGSFLANGDGVTVNRIARWNGNTWSSLGSGMSDGVHALAVMPNGDLIAGGSFSNAGGVPASAIAKWNGSSWSALGAGVDINGIQNVSSLAVVPLDGGGADLIVAGFFTSAGGAPANHIARWDGSTWSALGAGLNTSVGCIALDENGDVLVGGYFTSSGATPLNHIARWNGQA